MDDGRPSESTTLAYLLKEASKDDKALIKQYFLTVFSEGNVRIGNKVDDTQDLILHQQDIPLGERFWLPDKSSKPCCGHISDICLTAFWDIFRHTHHHQWPIICSPQKSITVQYLRKFVTLFTLSQLHKLHFKCYVMALQVQTICHSSHCITNLAVIQVS